MNSGFCRGCLYLIVFPIFTYGAFGSGKGQAVASSSPDFVLGCPVRLEVWDLTQYPKEFMASQGRLLELLSPCLWLLRWLLQPVLETIWKYWTHEDRDPCELCFLTSNQTVISTSFSLYTTSMVEVMIHKKVEWTVLRVENSGSGPPELALMYQFLYTCAFFSMKEFVIFMKWK